MDNELQPPTLPDTTPPTQELMPTPTRNAPPSPTRPSKRFTQRTVVGARGLLPMLYRPAELCRSLGVTDGELHDWMRRGLPFQRDARGHLWFDG